MITKSIKISNKLGLHARASAKFVATANRFLSRLNVSKGNQTINGKSIMSVMMLAATQGTELTLQFNGVDEEDMAIAMLALIEGRFGEPE